LWRAIAGLWPFSPTCGVASLICHLVFVALKSWYVAVFYQLLVLPPSSPILFLWRFIRGRWPFSPTCGVAPIISNLLFVALNSWSVAAF
jgi:hypothetical protein